MKKVRIACLFALVPLSIILSVLLWLQYAGIIPPETNMPTWGPVSISCLTVCMLCGIIYLLRMELSGKLEGKGEKK